MRCMETIVFCLLASVLCAQTGYARNLLQTAPAPGPAASGPQIPAGQTAQIAASDAISAASPFLTQYGIQADGDLGGIEDVTFLYAAQSADSAGNAAVAGQSSAVYASIAATGAALLTAGGVQTNNGTILAQAASAIRTANQTANAVQDQEILGVSASQFANLAVLAALGTDVSSVLSTQNKTTAPGDNTTLAGQATAAGSLYTAVGNQLQKNLSTTLALLSAQAAARSQLAGIYSYNGNKTAVIQQNTELGMILLKAVTFTQSGISCQGNYTAVDLLLQTAFTAVTTTDGTVNTTQQALTDAITAQQAVLSAASCPGLAFGPSLAPGRAPARAPAAGLAPAVAPTVASTSAGRR